eukprot:1127982-Rhodomonas_salina.1
MSGQVNVRSSPCLMHVPCQTTTSDQRGSVGNGTRVKRRRRKGECGTSMDKRNASASIASSASSASSSPPPAPPLVTLPAPPSLSLSTHSLHSPPLPALNPPNTLPTPHSSTPHNTTPPHSPSTPQFSRSSHPPSSTLPPALPHLAPASSGPVPQAAPP